MGGAIVGRHAWPPAQFVRSSSRSDQKQAASPAAQTAPMAVVSVAFGRMIGMFSVSTRNCLNRYQHAGLMLISPAVHLMLKQSFHRILLTHSDRCLL